MGTRAFRCGNPTIAARGDASPCPAAGGRYEGGSRGQLAERNRLGAGVTRRASFCRIDLMAMVPPQ